MTFKVGQALYYVPANRRDAPASLTIEKVGRKWLTTDGPRINAATLYADGGNYSSPGHCYLSREDYERHRADEAQWVVLRDAVGRAWRVPDGVDAATIRQAMAMLKVMAKA